MDKKYKEIEGKQYLIANPSVVNESESVCFFVEGKYYRLSKGSITYDYFKKKYVLKTSINVENGFVGINPDDDTPILGDWSWPENHFLENNVLANYKGHKFFCISETIFKDTNWQERFSDGEYYHKGDLPAKEFSKIKSVPKEVKNSYAYNTSNNLDRSIQTYNDNYRVVSYNKGVASYPRLTGNYTFGVEFETIMGMIPDRICNKLGLIPLRDGSIDGIEYATVPLSGKQGLQTLIDSCQELDKRTSYNSDCSLHIHIGGVPRTEAFFVALTKVLCHVQDEMYSLFPFCMKGGYNLKKKDYTAPLPAIDLLSKIDNSITSAAGIKDNFEHVFDFLSMGQPYTDYNRDLRRVKDHPSDPRGDSKWHIRSRYRWVNMIPLLFGNKQTIEFRIHTPTYDHTKIIFYLVMCCAILDFVVKQEKDILTGERRGDDMNLSTIISLYLSQFGDKYSNLYEDIHYYIIQRKKHMKNYFLEGNFYGDEPSLKSPSSVYKDKSNNEFDILDDNLKGIFTNKNKKFKSDKKIKPGLSFSYESSPQVAERQLRDALRRNTNANRGFARTSGSRRTTTFSV